MAGQSNNKRARNAAAPASESIIPAETVASGATAPRSKASGQATKPAAHAARANVAAPHVQPRRAERRPEMIRQQREARRQAYEKRRRQWLITRIGLAAFGLVVVAGIGLAVYSYVQDRRENRVPEGTVSFQYSGSDHTASLEETVQYPETPPVGGRHAPAPYWQNCGYYNAPVQNESAVHSMEHGAVWITYRPDLPPEQVEELRDIAEDNSYVLVSPFPDLPAPVVASAWNRQIQLESADDERLDQFVRRFRRSPDAPETQGVCTGGVGDPLT